MRGLLGVTSLLLALCVFPAGAGPSRFKVIDFEDELIEGVNKQPLDSLSQISEANRRRKKLHLYRKRVGFKSENAETLRELRLTQ